MRIELSAIEIKSVGYVKNIPKTLTLLKTST